MEGGHRRQGGLRSRDEDGKQHDNGDVGNEEQAQRNSTSQPPCARLCKATISIHAKITPSSENSHPARRTDHRRPSPSPSPSPPSVSSAPAGSSPPPTVGEARTRTRSTMRAEGCPARPDFADAAPNPRPADATVCAGRAYGTYSC